MKTSLQIVNLLAIAVVVSAADPPVAPSGLVATVLGQHAVLLQWQDNSTNENAFRVERATSPDGPWVWVARVGASVTQKRIGHLRANTTYYFRVTAVNGSGRSAYSNPTSATTWPPPDTKPPRIALTQPVAGEQVSGLVTISATATDNVAVARVEFYVDAAFQGAVTNEPYSMFWDTTVIVDGAHTITATAFDGAGLTNSASVTITTSNGVQLSGAPTNLTASPISDTAIMLTWLDNSDNEDGFQIERALSADGPWTLVATVGPNVTTFMDSDLQPQVVYFYRVRACVGCAPPIAVASTH